MAQLWRAGVRGGALTVVSAWKDVLLLVGARARGARARRLPFTARRPPTGSRSRFGALVVLYGVLPQSWLGGGATHKGVLYARAPRPAAGRRVLPRPRARPDRERARVASAAPSSRSPAFVAAFGLIDVYLVPLSWWRHVGGLVPRPARPRLPGPLGPARELRLQRGQRRRLPAADLDVPLAARDRVPARGRAVLPARCARRWGAPLALLLFAALLWTHTRAALLALVVGLLAARGSCAARVRPLVLAVVVAVLGVRVRQGLRPLRAAHALHGDRARAAGAEREAASRRSRTTRPARTSRRPSEHLAGAARGHRAPSSTTRGASASATRASPPRARTSRSKAGESTYTELGVETGLARRARLRRVVARHCCARLLVRRRGSAPRSPRCSCSACRPT